jgi:hypothetical protein
MTVESFLTRELQVRFIDARNLATEAKLNLGVFGYPSHEQQEAIIEEALKVFQQRPNEVQAGMRRLSSSLDAVKLTKDSDDSSQFTARTSISTVDSDTSSKRSKVRFWSTRRR